MVGGELTNREMEALDIDVVKLAGTNCFLLKGESVVMIDAGFARTWSAFEKATAKIAVSPADISLLFSA